MLNKAEKSAADHSQQPGYKKEKDQNKLKGSKSCGLYRFSFHQGGKNLMDKSTCPACDNNNCRKCQRKGHHASSVANQTQLKQNMTKSRMELNTSRLKPLYLSLLALLLKKQSNFRLNHKPQYPE